MWVTGAYDVATNQVLWGTGNPVPMFDPYYRPGDNLYTNSLISWDPDTGKMNWYLQYMPGDMWDYDEAGTHILIDGQVAGQPRKLITHSARNGFLYTFERANGQTRAGKTLCRHGQLDRAASTRRPDCRSNTIPTRTSKSIPAGRTRRWTTAPRNCAPPWRGGNNYWSLRPTARGPSCVYIPSVSTCNQATFDPRASPTRPATGSGAVR